MCKGRVYLKCVKVEFTQNAWLKSLPKHMNPLKRRKKGYQYVSCTMRPICNFSEPYMTNTCHVCVTRVKLCYNCVVIEPQLWQKSVIIVFQMCQLPIIPPQNGVIFHSLSYWCITFAPNHWLESGHKFFGKEWAQIFLKIL